MEYFNILHTCDLQDKIDNIDIELGNINNSFCWHSVKLNDKGFESDLNSPLFLETPLLFVNDISRSQYNNQYYLDVKPEDFQISNFIIRKFENQISNYLTENNSDYILKKSNINSNLFIDIKDKPLFYSSNKETITQQINGDFLKNILNSKIKCIIKPLLWSKKLDTTIIIGIKLTIKQCLLSGEKHLNDTNIKREKILSLKKKSCPICYNDLSPVIEDNGSGITKLPCGHEFHFRCINNWYSTQISLNNRFSCPYCRN